MPDHSERKLATVLFADLVDSTAAAGDQDPERTRARLERFYDAMSAEIVTAQANERFRALGLYGHAAQTEVLAGFRNSVR